MKNTLNICQLPDLVLEDIALFLEPADIVNLSEASTCFQDLRRLLPKYLPLEGEDFKNQRDRRNPEKAAATSE